MAKTDDSSPVPEFPTLLSADKNLFSLQLIGQGYVGVDAEGHGVIAADIAEAARFRVTEEKGAAYYGVVGGAWDGYYLSASNGGQVGVYAWSNCTSWSISGTELLSQDGKQLTCPGNDTKLYLGTTGTFEVERVWPFADHSTWIADLYTKLPDTFGRVPLLQLPLPGSHDSGTYGMGVSARTQNLTILEQLVIGIRYFDIRPRVKDGVFYIHHGPLGSDNHFAVWPKPENLDDFPCILLDIRNFLLANKGEYVVLKFQSFDGEGGQSFNTDDHKHFRELLNSYLTLVAPHTMSNLTVQSLQSTTSGAVFVFYDDIGAHAAAAPGDDSWANIWPYLTDGDAASSSACIRLWDPFWDDTSEALADEETDASGAYILSDKWKTYHRDNLGAWVAMLSGRFMVTQAQMQVARGSGMTVDGYFSKVERSAIRNNHLNIELFADWMTKGVPLDATQSGSTRLNLRPNVLSLDFVEFGSLCDEITEFFGSLTPSDFDQTYDCYRMFEDGASFALSVGSSVWAGDDGGWAVPVAKASDAMRFRIRIDDTQSYFMIVGGDYDGRYLSLNSQYCLGWYKAWNDARAWSLADGKLLSAYSSKYVQDTAAGKYLYADADTSNAATVSYDWS